MRTNDCNNDCHNVSIFNCIYIWNVIRYDDSILVSYHDTIIKCVLFFNNESNYFSNI
jgi:hypothetical protein